MAKPTDTQRKWLEELAALGGDQWTAPTPDAAPDEYASVARLPKPAFDPLKPLDPARMQEILEESAKERAKEALAKIEKAKKALAEAKAYLSCLDNHQIQKLGYAKLIAEVRKKYPEAANLAALAKEYADLRDLKGKLPNKDDLLKMVKGVVKDKGLDFSLEKLDPVNAARELLLAAYMSELPAGVELDIVGGVVQLTVKGAALSVATPAGKVEAKAGKEGAEISLKAKDYGIEVTNEGWKDFDPKLRANWQRISDEAKQVATLEASLKEVKAKYEAEKKKDGSKTAADLKVDLEKRTAEFNLRWEKLQTEVKATAKASEEKISASVTYLKKDKADKEAVKAGADVEVDLKAMQGKLKAYYTTPTLKAVLDITASAEKVSAKLEVAAAKSGIVVTAKFEKALDETLVAIEAVKKFGDTTVTAQLEAKANDLKAKIKAVRETKDLKVAAQLEATLKEVRASVEVEYTKGKTKLKAGASASTTGDVEGQAKIEIALAKGQSFPIEGASLSLTANVSSKDGYSVGIQFSMGEPVDTGTVTDVLKTVEQQIKELYKLAGDAGIRSIKDAQELQKKFEEVMAPVKKAVEKAKAVPRDKIQITFGFSLQGAWPKGGKAAPPTPMFGISGRF